VAGRARVTMLFCDLVGSTSLLTRLGDTASDIVRHDVFTALRRPVEVHGGDEVKSQGDGLMVAFRGDASDAVTCAIAMQQAMSGLDRHQPLLGLALRVGIATGEATSEDGDWFGTPVVEAARLCAAAAPGQVLVAESVVGDAHGLGVPYQSVGALDLKGFPEPRPTWSVPVPIADADAPALPPGLDPAGEQPFEGREDERLAMRSAIERAGNGEPQVVLIVGDAGAGKTRLAAEVASEAAAAGAAVLYGRVREERDRPLGPLVDALRWHLATRTPQADPAQESASGLVATLTRTSEVTPIVLVLDDLQRAATPLLALLADLAEVHAPCRVVVIGLFRERPGAGDDDPLVQLLAKLEGSTRVTMLRLAPMGVRSAAALLAPATPGVVLAVLAETEGNPGLLVEARRRLAAANAFDDEHGAREALATGSPYKGLAAFGVEDHELFFGRDSLVAALIERLERTRFLAIVGASGSGKSSLVRAGLLARLGATAVITPGAHPSPSDIPPHGLLFVDQLEECFALCDDDDVRTAFLDALLDASVAVNGPTVVVALRADFFGHATSHPRLAAALETSTAVLAPMTEAELRDAIELPADIAGLRLESGLADVVLADIQGEPGGLPLLSHALLETWRRRRGRTLAIADYREAGGAKGAIARTADRVYTEQLLAEEQPLARAIFLRLTELGEGVDDTKRRASRQELETLGDTVAIDRALGALVDARLIVTEDGYVEVAHEALIREWPRLRGWLDDNRDAIRTHRHLSRAASDWDASGRPDTDLYRGARLDATLQLIESDVVALNAREREFVEASAAERDRDRNELAERARVQTRSNKRLRLLLTAAGIALVATVVASTLAISQRNRADDQARVASDRARVATARGLVVRAPTLAEAQPDVALLLAVEALKLDDSPESRAAMASALLHRPQLLSFVRPTSGPYPRVIALPGEGVLAANGRGLDRWTALDPRPVSVVTGVEPIDVAASGDGSLVAIAAKDGTVRVLRVNDGSVVLPPTTPADGMAGHVAMSSDGKQVAVGTTDGKAVVYDVASGATSPTLDASNGAATDGPAPTVAFGPHAGQVTTASYLGTVRSWDIATAAPGPGLNGGYPTTALAVSGSHVATGSPGALGTIPTSTVGDIDTGQPLQAPIGRFISPDGALSVGLPVPGTVPEGIVGIPAASVTRDANGVVTPTPAPAPAVQDRIPVTFTPDGSDVIGVNQIGGPGVVVASTIGTTSETIDAGVGPVRDISVSPDGSTMVITGDAVAVWALGGRQAMSVRTYGPEQLAIDGVIPAGATLTGALSPDGTRIVVTSALSPSRVLDATTGLPTSPLIKGTARFADDATLIAGSSAPFVLERVRSSDGTSLSPALDLGEFATTSFAANPARDRLALANGTRVQIVRTENERLIIEPFVDGIGSSTATISGLAYSADGNRLAVASSETLTVYDVNSKAQLTSVALEGQKALSVEFSRDGKLVAVGTGAGPVLLFDAATMQPLNPALQGHTGNVVEVAFSPDGQRLASMAADGTVRIWDVNGHQLLGQPLPTITEEQLSALRGGTMSFSVDGRILVAPTPSGLSAWQVDPNDWAATACRIVNRSLTRDEWNAYLPPGTPYRETCATG
jgi:class 3 adenylate cyclase/WD40 repeat protein